MLGVCCWIRVVGCVLLGAGARCWSFVLVFGSGVSFEAFVRGFRSEVSF